MEKMLLARGSGMNDDRFELILLTYREELKRYMKTSGSYLEQFADEVEVVGDRAYMSLDTMSLVAKELGFESWEITLI